MPADTSGLPNASPHVRTTQYQPSRQHYLMPAPSPHVRTTQCQPTRQDYLMAADTFRQICDTSPATSLPSFVCVHTVLLTVTLRASLRPGTGNNTLHIPLGLRAAHLRDSETRSTGGSQAVTEPASSMPHSAPPPSAVTQRVRPALRPRPRPRPPSDTWHGPHSAPTLYLLNLSLLN